MGLISTKRLFSLESLLLTSLFTITLDSLTWCSVDIQMLSGLSLTFSSSSCDWSISKEEVNLIKWVFSTIKSFPEIDVSIRSTRLPIECMHSWLFVKLFVLARLMKEFLPQWRRNSESNSLELLEEGSLQAHSLSVDHSTDEPIVERTRFHSSKNYSFTGHQDLFLQIHLHMMLPLQLLNPTLPSQILPLINFLYSWLRFNHNFLLRLYDLSFDCILLSVQIN